MKKTAESKNLKDDASNYDQDAYEKPSVTVDIAICSIVDRDLKVLLVKRKYPPFKNMWAIPGGFVDPNEIETLDDAASRELYEETNLKDIHFDQLKSYGDPERDPRMRIITIVYYALLPIDKLNNIQAGDDAKETAWFSLRKLPDMAFDHEKILSDLLIKLKEKVLTTSIVFELFTEKFTWEELQDTYETFLNKKLAKEKFRHKIELLFEVKILEKKNEDATSEKPQKFLSFIKEKDFFD